MIFVRLFAAWLLLLAGLVVWSWLRTKKGAWIRRYRGAVGWVLAACVVLFLVVVLRALLP